MSNTVENLRLAALDRHRKRLFGDSTLTAWTITPEAGEAQAGEFTQHWSAQRIDSVTDDASRNRDAGGWQFQVAVPADWADAQAFWRSVTILTVGDVRWRVKKAERPIGVSLVWKLRAEMQ